MKTSLFFLVSAWLTFSVSATVQQAEPFFRCEEAFRIRPDEPDSATCFYLAAQPNRQWLEATEHLLTLKREYPGNYWLDLTLGHLHLVRGEPQAEDLYRQAADGFASANNAAGEVLALTNLRNYLYRHGRVEESTALVLRASAVAARSADPAAASRAYLLEANHILETGGDLGGALRSVRQSVSKAVPNGSYGLQRQSLFLLARICTRIGRYEEARGAYQQLSALMREQGDLFEESTVEINRANLLLRELEELPNPERLKDVIELATMALEKARDAGNEGSEALAHRLLGEVLGGDPSKQREAAAHLEACLRVAKSFGQADRVSGCLWTFSGLLAEADPGRSAELLDQAVELALETDDPLYLAYAWQAKMKASWHNLAPREALTESVRALSAIESLRDFQEDEAGSLGLFSQWARDYQWLAGRLLTSGQPDSWSIPEAFSVMERMRARFLLDRLARSRISLEPSPSDPRLLRRREITGKIVQVQRELLASQPNLDQRRSTLAELDRLASEEAELRSELSRRLPPASTAEPRFTGLSVIQGLLQPDEALLSFQVALEKDILGRFGGGAWLSLATNHETRVFRIPDRVYLSSAIPVFLGLLERRDRLQQRAAVRLYQDLLAAALESLPPGIRRLVIIPDGMLHYLPFGALSQTLAGPPVAAEYELTVVPSATLWSLWRSQPASQSPLSLLVLADPVLDEAQQAQAGGKGWPLAGGTPLDPLPFARQEGRALVRHVGSSSRLLIGEEASEAFVKQNDLSQFRILHLAAHAILDEENPQRSAVLLSPGNAGQDGLWQTREIVDAGLRGQLVVLSACRTASGSVLSGEGVVGLARAFFQAGAGTVVGSLWPLRDDEAAWFFDRFYRYLSKGSRVTAAVRATQREALEANLPAAAWSGIVVLGRGDLVPFPGGLSQEAGQRPGRVWLLAGLSLLLGVVLFFRWRSSRPR